MLFLQETPKRPSRDPPRNLYIYMVLPDNAGEDENGSKMDKIVCIYISCYLPNRAPGATAPPVRPESPSKGLKNQRSPGRAGV